MTLYFNDTVVVLVDFLPSSLLSSDAIVSKLKDRLSSPEGISFSLYYAPFAVTKIEPPSSIHALPPSPFEDTTPPSNTPLIVAAGRRKTPTRSVKPSSLNHSTVGFKLSS